MDKAQLPMTQTFEKSDGVAPPPFVLAMNFLEPPDLTQINITVYNGTATLLGGCPEALSQLSGFILCYSISAGSMPSRDNLSLVLSLDNLVFILSNQPVTNTFDLYVEQFSILNAIGSAETSYMVFTGLQLGDMMQCDVSKFRL
jgi:hypothetical protein